MFRDCHGVFFRTLLLLGMTRRLIPSVNPASVQESFSKDAIAVAIVGRHEVVSIRLKGSVSE